MAGRNRQATRGLFLDPGFAALACAWAAMIAWVGTRAGDSLGKPPWWLMFDGADKFVHAFLYGGLAFLLWAALTPMRTRPLAGLWRSWLAAVGIPALLGLLDEVQQGFRPGRSSDPWDWVADLSGALLAALAGRLIWEFLWRRGEARLPGSRNDGREASAGQVPPPDER